MCPVSDPAVSVIIATYNWSTVLPFSIGSVLQQTFADFELLVIGDGCTDDSEQVVRAIDDPRVTWVNIARTGHQSGPNNEGLRRARGRVIAYLGHDDLWLRHHLQTHVASMDGGSDFTCSLAATIGPDDSFIDCIRPDVRRGRYTPPSAFAHRHSIVSDLGGWRDHRDLRIPPDWELVRRVRAAGARVDLLPRLTVLKFPALLRRSVYRQRPFHEQKQWLERIRREPELEAILLGRIFAEPSRQLSGTWRRIWRLLRRPTLWWSFLWRSGGSRIRAQKRCKGVDDAARSAEGSATRHQ
jgi:glycosyltransferase involved in cell wall biosynthesis